MTTRPTDCVRIRVAGPDEVRAWSSGAVTSSRPGDLERPHAAGLFSERIFGPLRDWCCGCRREGRPHYHGPDHAGSVCPRCSVVVGPRHLRRQRMGHIELAAPVVHPWFLHGRPSFLSLLLDLTPRALAGIVAHRLHVVVEPGSTGLDRHAVIDRPTFRRHRARERAGPPGGPRMDAPTGGQAVRRLLQALELPRVIGELRHEHDALEAAGRRVIRRRQIVARLRVLEALRDSGNRPECLVLDCLSVIPPDLRPVRQTVSTRTDVVGDRVRAERRSVLVSSDLNEFYRRILIVNERLRKHQAAGRPPSVCAAEQVLLQRWVDGLFDNERLARPFKAGRKAMRSLTDLIEGKEGRFRQNLLGKRVDYSARSVIVAGPRLKLHQCGLPRVIARELFRPFVLGVLARRFREQWLLPRSTAILAARHLLDGHDDEARHVLRQALTDPAQQERACRDVDERPRLIEEALREAMAGRLVLLNRAPTLHRMNVQAFEPVLTDGKAIEVPPLVCEGFNADFDGDTMAVHLPLSGAAQSEAAALRPAANLLAPAAGQPLTPSNEIVLGCYYLTADGRSEGKAPRAFASIAEVQAARDHGRLGTHDPIRLRLPPGTQLVRPTAEDGTVRVRVPSGPAPEGACWLRVEEPGASDFDAGELVRSDEVEAVARALQSGHRLPPAAVPLTADDPALADGFLPGASGLIHTTAGRALFNGQLPAGLPYYDLPLSRPVLGVVVGDGLRRLGRDRTAELLDVIKDAGFKAVTAAGLSLRLDDLKEPSNRGAVVEATRKEVERLRQRQQRGQIDHDERYRLTVEHWQEAQDKITACMVAELARDERDGQPGLNPLYLMARSRARGRWEQVRQLTALRGLMARPSGPRPVLEHAITGNLREGLGVHEYFLSTHGARKAGADKDALPDSGYLTRRLIDAAHHVLVTTHDCGTTQGVYRTVAAAEGRVSLDDVPGPDGRLLQAAGARVSENRARRLSAAGVAGLRVRSPMTCAAPGGVCQLCYGVSPSTGDLVELGTAVGILAAQSIGEPGTQLAMRTKHTGGVVLEHDMVSALDHVIALFDASRPERSALLAPCSGVVVAVGDGPRPSVDIVPRPEEMEREITSPVYLERGTPTVTVKSSAARRLVVSVGDRVEVGQPLTDGTPALDDLLCLHGIDWMRHHLLGELRRVYRTVDERHFEVIVAQMLSRVEVLSAGDTGLLPGALLVRGTVEEANRRLEGLVRIINGGESSSSPGLLMTRQDFDQQREAPAAPSAVPPRLARARPVLLGVRQLALLANSFLSAASFQQAGKVLAEAALAGRVDPLEGLKENVILGRLIPAGTGFRP